MSKKALKRFLAYAAAIGVTGAAIGSDVATETVNGIVWTYTVTNGVASVGDGGDSTGVPMSTPGQIAVPSKLGGYPVTSIGAFAFSGCSRITSVTIGNGVTRIGWYAFYGCSGLTSVMMPDSVAYIGGRAFEGCHALTSMTIGEGVTNFVYNAVPSHVKVTTRRRKTCGR